MYGYLAFTLLVFGWASLSDAGDGCAMSHIQFCNCTEYLFKKTTNYTVNFNATAARAIAPTTSPKFRDPYKQTLVECDLKFMQRSPLYELASSLHRKWVDKLSIKNIPLDKENIVARLPNSWLKNVRVKQLEIKNTMLSGDFIWNGNPFAGQEHNLVWFSAISCSLTGALTYDTMGTVNMKGLEDLPGLEGLDLSGNHLITVQKSAFGHTHPKLKTVVLSRNMIQELLPGAFYALKSLQHIDLSHNALANVSRNIFSDHPKLLRRINLSWNRLQILPKDIFSNMSALKVVDVSNNFLYSLPEEPWKSVWWKLQFIDVTSNFIDCNCDLLWLLSNSTSSTDLTSKRTIKGQCARSLPSLFVRHFDLYKLSKDMLDCKGDDDDEYDDYYYYNV